MSTVYVVQEQHRWDHQRNKLVLKYDLSPALEYGNLSYLLSPTCAPWDTASVVSELTKRLKDFDPEQDYLLLVGNPCLIGLATALASRAGYIQLLQWSGKDRRYIPVRADLGWYADIDD